MAKTKDAKKPVFEVPPIVWTAVDGGDPDRRIGRTEINGIPVTIQVEWCPDRSDYAWPREHEEDLLGIDVVARAGVLTGAYDDDGIVDNAAAKLELEERGVEAALSILKAEIQAHPSLARTPVEREDDAEVKIRYETEILEQHPDDICPRARRGEQYLRQAKAQEARGEDPGDSYRMAATDLGYLLADQHECMRCGRTVRPGKCSICFQEDGTRVYGALRWCAGDLQLMAEKEGKWLTRREADRILGDNEDVLEMNLMDSDWEILSDMLPDCERDKP